MIIIKDLITLFIVNFFGHFVNLISTAFINIIVELVDLFLVFYEIHSGLSFMILAFGRGIIVVTFDRHCFNK